MQGSNSDVNNFLSSETFDNARLSNVLICAVAEPEVVAFAPGPDEAAFGQGQGKLGSAFDLNDSGSVELLHILRHAAALAAAPAQLAEIAIAPGKDEAFVRQGQRLCIPAAASHLKQNMNKCKVGKC